MDNRNFPIPNEIIDAVHKLIRSYLGGYSEMSKRLDPESGTENSLRNRVRKDRNDQQVTLGMILEMEAEADSNVITEAIARHQNGVFVKLPSVENVDNDDLLKKFTELVSELGQFCCKHNEFISDGILDSKEKAMLSANAYCLQSKLTEIVQLTDLIFGIGDR